MEASNEKLLILLVEDDPLMTNVTRALFESRGHEVMATTRFVDVATTLYDNLNRFVVAVVDINLTRFEDKTGIQILEYIKASASHYVMPYVYSGDSTRETALSVYNKGLAVGIISKDVDPDVLIAQVENPLVLEWARSATIDKLTGLPNYAAFKGNVIISLGEARVRKPSSVSTLIMFDGDGFKRINDEHDHEVGDQALKAIGRAITKNVRRTDPHCRRSGDEFFGFLPHTEELPALVDAKRIQCAVAASSFIGKNGKLVCPAVSYGMMQVSQEEISEDGKETLAYLLNGAETRLHESKEKNGNSR